MGEVNVFKDVLEFHKFFGHRVNSKPTWLDDDREAFRLGLIDEERKELEDALNAGDMVEVADALADMVYVIIGTAIEMGIPLEQVWNIVQTANMSKAVYIRHGESCALVRSDMSIPERCDCGAVQYTETGKTKKPEGWIDPHEQIKSLLRL